MPDEFDEIDINPRQAEEIAGRMIVLTALNRRIEIELSMLLLDHPNQYAEETDRFELYSWASKELHDWISIEELAVLKVSAGKMTDQQIAEHGYDLDAALALAWTLGIVASTHLSILPLGKVDPEIDRMMSWAPQPWDRVQGKMRRLKLRSEDVLWNERERCSIVWIRWLLNQLERTDDRRAALAAVVQEGDALGLPVKDEDLIFDGLPIGQLGEEMQNTISNTARTYLHALTWACGFGTSWQDVPLEEL